MDKAKQINEQKVLEEELKSLPKGATVYEQQQNSQIFFRADKNKVMAKCKKTLDSLIEEYKQAKTQ